MACFVELNDVELTVTDESGTEPSRQSAAAAWDGQQLLFGAEAAAVSRTLPQQFNQRYLMALSNQPLPVALGPAKNHADLIYRQLQALNLQDHALLGVPGYLSNEQLGYLLSICREAGLEVVGFADLGLLQSFATPLPERFSVLDLELHRMVLSSYEAAAGSRALNQCQPLDGLGRNHIVEGWLAVIADEFVQRTRFDPLHAGATEQQLYDQVLGWEQLTPAGGTERRLRVGAGDQLRELDIPQASFDAKLAQRLASLDLTGIDTLAITARVQRIPGLAEFLATRCAAVVPLGSDHREAFEQMAQALPQDSVQRMNALSGPGPGPARVAAEETGSATAEDQREAATHLLAEHWARPLAHFAAALENGAVVNDEPARGQRLKIGDEVTINGQRYLAIRVS